MSGLKKILALPILLSGMQDTYIFGGNGITPTKTKPDPEWKRKKCKSCRSCGSICNERWSKPQHNACRMYQKRIK